MSAADAETRLRYVQDVRARTRGAAVTPLVLVGMLGALIIVRGLLLLYWPHVAGLSGAWFLSVTVAGIGAALWLEQRQRVHSGVMPVHGSRAVMLVATFAAEFLANAIGTNVIIAGITVPLAFSEWRTRTRTTAVAIAVIGLICDALVLGGTRQWTALVIFGTGLIAVGVIARQTRGSA